MHVNFVNGSEVQGRMSSQHGSGIYKIWPGNKVNETFLIMNIYIHLVFLNLLTLLSIFMKGSFLFFLPVKEDWSFMFGSVCFSSL